MTCIEKLFELSFKEGRRIYRHPNGLEEEIVWTMWDSK